MKEYTLNGLKINSLEDFFEEFANMVHEDPNLGRNFGEPGYFGKSVQSFDDCLFGGFGLENPCKIIWKDSKHSRKMLGHEVYAKWCREQITKKEYLDNDGLKHLIDEEKRALSGRGDTMFSILVDIIISVETRSNGENIVKLVCS